MAMGDVIGRLSVVLGLDTAAFESGARRASKTTADTGDKMEQLGRRVGTAAKALIGLGAAFAASDVVRQVKDMAVAGLEHASALGEQAQQLGVTTGELQKYRFIATQVGIDQEVMDKGLAKLSITLGDLANGAKAPTEALQRLGLSQQQIAAVSQMTAGQAIPYLADAFAQLKSPTEAAAIAADLFGAKMGGKFLTLLMGGAAGINTLTESYKKLGIELTEGQIAKADEAMDKLAAMQEVFAAKQAQIAADNSDALLKGMDAWEQFKVQALVVFGELAEGFQTLKGVADKSGAWLADPFSTVLQLLPKLNLAIQKMASDSIRATQLLYQGVKHWVQDKLNEVWNWLAGKIESAKQQFFELYDAVVGHSYIPDMVDGIAHHMARLDDVMVKPVRNATEASKAMFAQLAKDVAGLMDQLFPESRRLADFQGELARLDKAIAASQKSQDGTFGGFTTAQLQAGRGRLINSADPGTLMRAGFQGAATRQLLADPMARFGPAFQADMAQRMKVLGNAMNDNSARFVEANRKVGDSFRTMADRTLDALDRMVGAVKGGGFLDILSAVIGLGLQLGSIGVFGKGFAGRINKVPGYAGGTSFHPGGLAMVGERGPELVNLPRGSQVVPNHALGAGGMTVHVVPSPFFDVRVQENIGQAAPAIAQAGALGGQRRMAFQQSRRVA